MGKKARRRAQAVQLVQQQLPAITDATGYGDISVTSDALGYKAFETLGATGTLFFAGIISGVEYNEDLRGEELLRTTDRMWRSSPQIAALLAVVMLPLLEAEWSIAAASDAAEDADVAQFVQDNLFGGLQRPFHEVLQGVLLEWLRDGFSILEKVYSPPDPEDGLIRLRKLAPRIPRSIYRWFPNTDDELDRIQQRVYVPSEDGIAGAYVYPIIPASKLVRFTHMQEGNNFAGISLLRHAYKPWYMLDQLERLACVAAERLAAGVPVFSEPAPPVQKSDRDQAAATLASLHAHEKTYLLEPHGWAFRFEAATGMNLLPLIEYFSLQIVRSVLAQFLNLDKGGSYALSQDVSGFFLQALHAKARYLREVWNSQVIRPLVDMNFAVDRYPTMEVSNLDKRDVDKALVGLARVLPWLTKNADTENAVRELLSLPDLPAEATPAGGNAPTVDTDSEGQGPSTEEGSASTAEETTQETGDESDAGDGGDGAAALTEFYTDADGVHPIRGSDGYSPEAAGESAKGGSGGTAASSVKEHPEQGGGLQRLRHGGTLYPSDELSATSSKALHQDKVEDVTNALASKTPQEKLDIANALEDRLHRSAGDPQRNALLGKTTGGTRFSLAGTSMGDQAHIADRLREEAHTGGAHTSNAVGGKLAQVAEATAAHEANSGARSLDAAVRAHAADIGAHVGHEATGDTFKNKDALKAAGWQFSGDRKAWISDGTKVVPSGVHARPTILSTAEHARVTGGAHLSDDIEVEMAALPPWLAGEVRALLTDVPAGLDGATWRTLVLETAQQELAA